MAVCCRYFRTQAASSEFLLMAVTCARTWSCDHAAVRACPHRPAHRKVYMSFFFALIFFLDSSSLDSGEPLESGSRNLEEIRNESLLVRVILPGGCASTLFA